MRLFAPLSPWRVGICFSPVAGIQWVETPSVFQTMRATPIVSFSPVAGIQWVETVVLALRQQINDQFQSRCRDSVG